MLPWFSIFDFGFSMVPTRVLSSLNYSS